MTRGRALGFAITSTDARATVGSTATYPLELSSEVAAALRYACAVLSRWNQLAPVSRLPSEILAAIFRYLIPSVEIGTLDVDTSHRRAMVSARARYLHKTRCLINMSHVYGLWRDVALNDAKLWSNIWAYNSDWTTEMVRRTADVPLTVIHSDIDPIEALWSPLSRLHDIQRLYLFLPYTIEPEVAETLRESLLKPAPLLEEFWFDFPRSFPIPYNLFSQSAPRLKSFFFECTLPADSILHLPILRGLTTLQLSRRSNDVDDLADPSKIVDVLRNNPDLETLVLHGFLSSADDADLSRPITENEIVHLPALSRLDLDEDTVACADFVRRLDVAALRMLTYDLCELVQATAIPLLLEPLQSASYDPIQTVGLAFKTTPFGRILVEFQLLYRCLHDLSEVGKSDNATAFCLNSVLPRMSEDILQVMNAVYAPWRLNDVRDFVLSDDIRVRVNPDLWIGALKRTRAIERLIIDCHKKSSFSINLILEPLFTRLVKSPDSSNESDDGADANDAEILLPRLHTICFRRCYADGDIPPSIIDALRLLCTRPGSVLRELHVIYGTINDSQRAVLSDFMRVVVWEVDGDGIAREPTRD